jgi:hypothetical protein
MARLIVCAVLLVVGIAYGNPPALIDYQGRIEVGGSAYDGIGYFKFAVSDAGNTNIWTQDGTSVNATEAPSGSVSNTVSSGVFSIMLGDASLGMQPLGGQVFEDETLYLRVWFATSAGGEYFELLPAQRLTSVPYALRADTANHLSTATNIVLNGHWLSGDGDNEGVYVDESGNVGVGTKTPAASLHVTGNARFDQGITYIPAMGDLSMGSYTNGPSQ